MLGWAGTVAAAANTPPTISKVTAQTIPMNSTTGALKITVGDTQTPASNLVLSAWSTNPVLTPLGSIVLGGLGSSRTVTITPATNQAALNNDTITVTVTDAGGLSTSMSFPLNVTNAANANTAPVIDTIPNQVIAQGTDTGPLPFIVSDNETLPTNLTVKVATANPGVVPLSGIVLSGKGSARTVQVYPSGMGTAKITLTVSDGKLSTSTSFTVKVTGPNTAPAISTPDNLIVPAGTVSSVVAFTISDAQKAAANLGVSVKSSNPALLPASGLVLGGSAGNRNVTLTPVPGQTGTSTVTLTVTDGSLSTVTRFIYAVFDAAAPANAFPRPTGIYALDSGAGTQYTRADGTTISLRDAVIRAAPFVDGYTLRVGWDDIEMAGGAYDFKIIDNIVTKLPAGKKLSLIITENDPADIATTPGVTTWVDTRNTPAITRAVPWDPYLRQRRDAFLQALATHIIPGGGTFANWPQLLAIDPCMPGGFTGIRDPANVYLRDLPGYTRAKFLAVVQDELNTLTGNFPSTYVQIGFWNVLDRENASYGGLAAWEYFLQVLQSEFNSGTAPRVGFFQENLAAGRQSWGIDPLDGRPLASGIAAPLAEAQSQTWTAFQALGSWVGPFDFTSLASTLYGTPGEGMEYAYNAFGTRYFELYTADIDAPSDRAELQRWHDFLNALPVP